MSTYQKQPGNVGRAVTAIGAANPAGWPVPGRVMTGTAAAASTTTSDTIHNSDKSANSPIPPTTATSRIPSHTSTSAAPAETTDEATVVASTPATGCFPSPATTTVATADDSRHRAHKAWTKACHIRPTARPIPDRMLTARMAAPT